MSEFGSNTGGLTIDDAGVNNTGIQINLMVTMFLSRCSYFMVRIFIFPNMALVILIFDSVGSSGQERLRISSDNS